MYTVVVVVVAFYWHITSQVRLTSHTRYTRYQSRPLSLVNQYLVCINAMYKYCQAPHRKLMWWCLYIVYRVQRFTCTYYRIPDYGAVYCKITINGSFHWNPEVGMLTSPSLAAADVVITTSCGAATKLASWELFGFSMINTFRVTLD